jgi:peptidoglycan hydrolase-like protein with peptidoglycan-binding domain
VEALWAGLGTQVRYSYCFSTSLETITMRIVAIATILAVATPGAALAKKGAVAEPLTPEVVNAAEFRTGGKLSKPVLVKAQVLLDRARFSPGLIDGTKGENLTKAIAAFERHKGLLEDGKMDPETWAKLVETSQDPAVVEYTISEADLKGPFTRTFHPRWSSRLSSTPWATQDRSSCSRRSST